MNKAAVLVLKNGTSYTPEEPADLIGVDRGALTLADAGIRMSLAVGDFDSVQESDVSRIEAYAEEVIRLNPIKDDSDSEHAVRTALARGYEHLYITGALGGRIDHELVNLRLAYLFPGKVILVSGRNRIRALLPGTYELSAENHGFISFFAVYPAVISLNGFVWDLDHRTIRFEDLYGLSNRISEEKGIVTVHEGTVLMIRSED